MKTSKTVAQEYLNREEKEQEDLAKNNASAVTLVHWRLCRNTALREVLQDFASRPEWSVDATQEEQKHHLEEVLNMFHVLNDEMWKQDSVVWPDLEKRRPSQNQFPIVFGGKCASIPSSIPETLVQLLVESCSKVYTVSRSVVASLPDGVVHISKSNLQDAELGSSEFHEVLDTATTEWQSSCPGKTLVIYFTLGKHTGVNPFAANVASVDNLCSALKRIPIFAKSKNFRIVLTGTDATHPSTHPDSTVEIDGQTYTAPTYKIFKYNYVYAMSKLYQFYKIACTLLNMVGTNELQTEWTSKMNDIVSKLKSHIVAVGDNGVYDAACQTNILSMERLNDISHLCDTVQDALYPHLHVAKGISICYTPLHATPWTSRAHDAKSIEESSQGSPRTYLIQQVVRRTKNAISTQMAARLHLEIAKQEIKDYGE